MTQLYNLNRLNEAASYKNMACQMASYELWHDLLHEGERGMQGNNYVDEDMKKKKKKK